MLGLSPSCESKKPGESEKTGEGEKIILSWFTKEAILTRKDITGEEMNKLLKEELNACAPPYPYFDKFVCADEEEGNMDEDDEAEVDGEMGKALQLAEIEEGQKAILSWFTKEARPNPNPNPVSSRLRYLFKHLDEKKIKAVLTRKDITGEDMNKLLKEELNAIAPPYPEFDKFLRDKEEKDMDEDMDKDEEDVGSDEVEVDGEMGKADEEDVGSDEVEVDGEMGKALQLAEIDEGKKAILGSFTKEARPNPNPNPVSFRLRYLFEHVDEKKIKAVLTRKDITGEELHKLLKEELNAIAPHYPEFDKFVRDKEEKDMDEVEAEGEMAKMLQLGDQEKPGIMKRPQLSLVQSELECKKPRVAEGLGFQGGEPVAAEM